MFTSSRDERSNLRIAPGRTRVAPIDTLPKANYQRSASRHDVQRMRQATGVSRLPRPTLLAAALLTIFSATFSASRLNADTLVLRDFTVLPSVQIEQIDRDGVKISGARRLDWGEIRHGEVAPELQAQFNQFLSELGPTLYRLRYRLELKDYANVGELALSLQETYTDSSSAGAQLVQLAMYRHELSQGRRASALAAWLNLQQSFDPSIDPRSPLLAWPQGSVNELWDPELPPVWFDEAEAKLAWPQVQNAFARLQAPSIPCRLYFASVALAVGDSSAAQEQTRLAAANSADHRDWVNLLRLREARLGGQPGNVLSPVESRLEMMSNTLKPLAFFELGLAKTSSEQPLTMQRGMLDLLRVPAEFSQAAPDLAAAALDATATTLEQMSLVAEAQRVRSELQTRFPDSWQIRHADSSSPP